MLSHKSQLFVGDTVKCLYPSSKDGSPTTRVGRVEKIDPKGRWFLMELSNGSGFRTLHFGRIIGQEEGCQDPQTGEVLSFGHCGIEILPN